MYSAKLVGNQMDTVFGLYLPEYEVPAPKVQTNYKEVPYRDGAIDKTAPDGVVTFEDREWSLVFQKTGEDVSAYDVPALSASLMNAIHGKSGEIIFDDDPNYKWVGRVFVENVQCENNGLIIANISLITQPYKYGIQDIVVTDTIETEVDEYQGSIVSFEYALGKELTKLLAHITHTQDLHGYGHPWPGGGGKNLFQTTATSKTESGVTWTVNDDGSITVTGTATGGSTIIAGAASVDASMGNVAISLDGISGATNIAINYVRLYDANGNQLAVIIGAGLSVTRAVFDLSQYADAAEIRVSLKRNNNVATNGTVHIQVEKGTSYTDWTPYSNICPISGLTGLSVYVSTTQDPDDATVYNVDWSTQAGTVYGGTLDVVTGVLTVSSILFQKNTADMNNSESFPGWKNSGLKALGFQTAAISDAVGNIGKNISFNMNGSNDIAFLPTNPYGKNQTEWIALAMDVQFVLPLATHVTYQLTSVQIAMLLGMNNVWSDAGDVDVTISTFDVVTLSNGRKPQSPKISVVSEGEVALMFFVKGIKHIVNLAAGEWSIPDLMLFEGDTDVYESGEGTVTYTYKEASL